MKAKNYPQWERLSKLALLASLLAAPLALRGQSDNFDSGTLDPDWKKAQFFSQSYTFVNNGTGKALRIQANPVPNTAPAAAAIIRTNITYTNFFMAVDIVNWADKNQAFVLLARWNIGAGLSDLAGASGMICNYDVAQYGENPTDRRQGQLQINEVFPGFATSTKAVVEMTLEPGHSYRITFEGSNTLYTAKCYDHHDLTTPLAVIQADSATYESGYCGILSFSRASTTGTTDVTLDNYYAGQTDPNPAAAPARAHPIAGTPIVETRVPAQRWKNFHNPASGISFTAKTYTASLINSAATKLYLNGVDVSSQLTLSANASTITGSLPGSVLQSNAVYAGRIELTDTTGLLTSTNAFWFDTFSEAFLEGGGGVKTIEAEDCNYNGGQFQLDPIPVSGTDTNGGTVNGSGVGYYGEAGLTTVNSELECIDYFDHRSNPEFPWTEYRSADNFGTVAGLLTDLADVNDPTGTIRYMDDARSKYVISNLIEYVVVRTEPGEWLNYTRNFDNTNYFVYLRVGSFGTSTVNLSKVTSDPTATNQTTSLLGSFSIPNNIRRSHFRYVPLMNGNTPAILSLAGTNTLRLTMAGTAGQDVRKLALNYLVFIPTGLGPATIFDNFQDANDSANPVWNRYDPIGGVTAPPASFTFPSGHYRIVAPAQQAPGCDAGPARAGSFLQDANYYDFYTAVDVLDFDDTVRQAFGIAARINTPGLGSTGGYLFSWEPGNGSLPNTTGGDLDISRLVNEQPLAQIETAPSSLHLTRGKSYRFVFIGHDNEFEGQVYEFPDLSNPLIRLPAIDSLNLYPSGRVGLIAASQSSCSIGGDATFDNFLATSVEPRLTINPCGNAVILTWPLIPFRLQSSPSLSPAAWTDVTTGVGQLGDHNEYTATPATGTRFFRLVYP